MAKTAKQSTKKKSAKTARVSKSTGALDRQMETLGRMAGRAANVLDQVRARGAATLAGLVPAKKGAKKKSASAPKAKARAKRAKKS